MSWLAWSIADSLRIDNDNDDENTDDEDDDEQQETNTKKPNLNHSQSKHKGESNRKRDQRNKDPFAMACTSTAAPPLQLYFDKTWKLSKKEDERQKDFTGPPERQSRRQSELSDHQSCLI